MAQSSSSDGGGWGAGFADVIFGVADRAIEYKRLKEVDVESQNDGKNVPGREDLIKGQGAAASSDSLGGAFKRAFAGVTVNEWGMVGLAGVGLVVGLVVLKKAKVL